MPKEGIHPTIFLVKKSAQCSRKAPLARALNKVGLRYLNTGFKLTQKINSREVTIFK